MTSISEAGNRLIYVALNYDRESLPIEHRSLLSLMTFEQKQIYDKIMKSVNENKGGLYYGELVKLLSGELFLQG